MHVSRIAPPHLEENTQPSRAVRAFMRAENTRLEQVTGTQDFNQSTSHALNPQRPTSTRENLMLVCSDEEGTVRAQDDETDLGFRGFGRMGFPLTEDKHTAVALFTFVDGFDQAVFTALLEKMKQLCELRNRNILSVWMVMAAGGIDDDPRSHALREAGFELGSTEQMSILHVPETAQLMLPDGIKAISFEGFIPPEEYVDSFLEIMAIADVDVPSAVEHEAAEWTRERLDEAAAHHARTGRTCLNMLLIDDSGVAAFSFLTIDPRAPQCAQQELTVVHRRARGRGLGMLVKQALWQELSSRFPTVKRVSTFNALTNTGMLTINEKLGMKPVALETSWQLRL